MQFRPCIDIHNGAVRQIVGGSLKDEGDQAITNFTSEYDARFYANLYRKDGIREGHIILLNPSTSEYFDATKSRRWRHCVHIRKECRSVEELPQRMRRNIWMQEQVTSLSHHMFFEMEK